MTHELKTWPEFFQAIADQKKRFEFRDGMDRDFKVGDSLLLKEFDPITKQYSGREILVDVTYILKVFSTHVVMSIAERTE